jgi:hypothetical protein
MPNQHACVTQRVAERRGEHLGEKRVPRFCLATPVPGTTTPEPNSR